MTTTFKRRDFMQLTTAGIAGLATSMLFGGCDDFIEQIRNRPTRRYIRSGSAALDQDILIYRNAVAAMKALPASDPRSWVAQAEIHYNHCPHGSWFFFPWHRAYLLYFERICQDLTGETNWGLPYWNWSSHPNVPSQFWGNASNPLMHSPRNATAASTAPAAAVSPSVLSGILGDPNFLTFAGGPSTSGGLEATPHNHIHGFVGGTMGGYHSPLDPIFWCHHNMVECCWVDWNIVRGNSNTNDSTWLNHDFNGDFVDETGTSVDISVVGTLFMPLFSYQFEPSNKGDTSDPAEFASNMSNRELRQLRDRLKEGTNVTLDYRRRAPISENLAIIPQEPISQPLPVTASDLDLLLADERKERMLLSIESGELPGTTDFFIRVFVNKPDANAQTSVDDPHFAGSFAFFTDPEADHHGGHGIPNYMVDLTNTVRRLKQGGSTIDPNNLNVQLVAVPYDTNPNEVSGVFRAKSLELGFTPVLVKGKDGSSKEG